MAVKLEMLKADWMAEMVDRTVDWKEEKLEIVLVDWKV